MKIFAVHNGNCESDFNLQDDMCLGGSNAHSGGAVVIAENLEDAKKMLEEHMHKGMYDKDQTVGTLVEVPLKAGVVIVADGDC